MNGRSLDRAGRLAVVALVSISISLLAFGAFSSGCGNGSGESSIEEYKKQWTEIMDSFQARVLTDDKKANELINKNDIAGVIKLVNQRILNVDEVTKKILVLRPPKDLRKVHAVTLYYLASLRDQLRYQNDLNDAVLTGKPTQDLKAIADQAALKTRVVGSELGVEIQKVDMKLKSTEEQPEPKQSATQSATKSATQ